MQHSDLDTEDEQPTADTIPSGSSRLSRALTLGGLLVLALVIGGVLWTSERNGPGASQFEIPTRTGYVHRSDAIAQATPEGGCVATLTMPGGANNYVPDAPMIENLGQGLIVSGTVREAGTCRPVRNARIQIWLSTARGGEGLASNRGSVLTDENGQYRLETSPVQPQFGQPHVHIAYDDGAYESLFLRSVMESKDVPSFIVDFVLAPSAD